MTRRGHPLESVECEVDGLDGVGLKRCPFCGGEATILIDETGTDERRYLPCCKRCDGMIERWFLAAGWAIDAWNRRADDATD